MLNLEISTKTIQVTDKLINNIKKREIYIKNIKVEMIKQWSQQGNELQQLQIECQCSQNYLTKLTGISKASVYNYMKISKDSRILELIESDHHGGQLECFNQKQLVRLTKLDDNAFEEAITTGSLAQLVQDTVIEATIVSKIEKRIKIEKPVVQINADGKEIARYPSASMAQFITGIDRMSIGKICRGESGRSHAGGCRWEFA